MRTSYSTKQIESLCQDLTNKVTLAYEAAGEVLDFKKTSIPYYNRLAKEITSAYEFSEVLDKVVYYEIKPAWLRDLFTLYRKKKTSVSIQTLPIKVCCYYLGFDREAHYWKSKEIPLKATPYCAEESFAEEVQRHWGKYQVYWKDMSTSKPTYQYDLVLEESQTHFLPVPNAKMDAPIYTGNPLKKAAGNIYVELVHPNQKERFFMIFNVGILNKAEILSGLLLGVSNIPTPIAFPVLLVNHALNIAVDANLITKYFGQFVQNRHDGFTKGLTARKMQKLLEDESNNYENRRLQKLQGSWLLYLLVSGVVERFKLYFFCDNRVICESTFNSYVEGTLESLGSTLKIELRNHNAYTSLLFEVGTILKLENLRQPVQVSYLSNERLRPASGTGVLIRTTLPYDDIIIPYFITPHSEEYEHLRQQGILSLLV